MGCANSKQKRCKHCQAAYSPVRRSVSMHVVHPAQKKGDSYHAVALTSSTLGSLALDSSKKESCAVDNIVASNGVDVQKDIVGVVANGVSDEKNIGVVNWNGFAHDLKSNELSVDLIEAKTWSHLIQSKITKVVPRTPVMTPPGEPETINTWELMAGLEDVSPFHFAYNHVRSFSFNVAREHVSCIDSPKALQSQRNGQILPAAVDKTIWGQTGDEDTHLKHVEFDPEIISTFRKSMEELSPDQVLHLEPLDSNQKEPPLASNDSIMEVNNNDTSTTYTVLKDGKAKAKDKVVLYFTSLRGVRKTYEDSCYVRIILRGLGVRLDERDVSMHSKFKEELRELLGEGFKRPLPEVFIGNKYIGGAEEIRQLNDEGKLEKIVEGCEMMDDGGEGCMGTCEACGDVRFLPCETCSGSCKIYYEFDDEEQEELSENEEGVEFGFRRCPDCNENGLIRCPICCE